MRSPRPFFSSRAVVSVALAVATTALVAGGCSSNSSLFGGAGTGGQGTGAGSTGGDGGAPPGCGDGILGAGEICDGAALGGASCTDLGYVEPAGMTCSPACQLDASGCSPACGNDVTEPGEDCDGSVVGTDCTDFGFVEAAGLACVGCLVDSSGCATSCGNGVAEPGEACDGADLGGHDCTEFGFVNGAGAVCAPGCASVQPLACAPACNGVLEPGETCDGPNLDGHDCTEFGFVNPGGLSCDACALDASTCLAVCGNGTVEPGEGCDDGNPVSGDGCSSTCASEALGDSCAAAIPVALALGTTTRSGNNLSGGTHAASCGGNNAGDVVYAVTAQANGFLTASLHRGPTTFDAVLYVSNACVDAATQTTILCVDSYDPQTNQGLDGGELLSFPVTQGQTVYLFVDGWSAADTGDYELVLDLSTGRDCSDPVPIPLAYGTAMPARGSNAGNTLDNQGSCGGAPGDEIVYRITRETTGPLAVDTTNTATNYNAVLYARSTCNSPATELACSNQGGNALESIDLGTVQGGTPVFVWVDGSQIGGGNPTGNYSLRIAP